MPGDTLAVVDIVFVAVVALSSIFGLFRGFVREALSLATWVAAFVVAALLGNQFAQLLDGLIGNPQIRQVAAFAILFVLTVFAGSLVANLLSGLTSRVGLGGTDRVLGGLFGVLRGVVVIVLIVLFTHPFEFSRSWYQDSLLVPWLLMLSEQAQGLMEPAGARP